MIFKSHRFSNTIEIAIEADVLQDDYRVAPDVDDPVIVQIEGRLARVLDISATGFCCRCKELSSGMRYRIRLNVPGLPDVIIGFVDVQALDQQLYDCRFQHLSAEHAEMLHQYVWQLQKHSLQSSMLRKRA